jgi:hypothetical protein
MKKGFNPYTNVNFPKQLTYRGCGVATSLGSKNFEAPTKLPNESVQKLLWEGGGSCNFFSTLHPLCHFLSILCHHVFSPFIHYVIFHTYYATFHNKKFLKKMLYNMNEKLKKCLHIMDEKLHFE